MDGQISPLEHSGAPLGAFPDSRYRDKETQVSERAVLLLYTDGVTEAHGPDGTLFGEHRLATSLKRWVDKPVEKLPGLVMDDVLNFSTGILRDDAAMLTVRYLGMA
jgi:sigma-B regulation protein RsbU (phosphoserine phosphatase)